MSPNTFELLVKLQELYVPHLLLAAGVILILIDYYFPTDVPCQFGYFCLAAAMFFFLPLSLGHALLAALAIWLLLCLAHLFCFRHFLDNAPSEHTAT